MHSSVYTYKTSYVHLYSSVGTYISSDAKLFLYDVTTYTVNKKNSLVDTINEYKLLDSRIRNEKSDLAISYPSNYLQKVDSVKLNIIMDKIIE